MLSSLEDRILGCLLAGAIGDALGAPVEFASLTDIRRATGGRGVSGYLPAYDADARFRAWWDRYPGH